MDDGEIVIDSLEPISLQDITHDLAIESGFESRADLLTVAKHGSGTVSRSSFGDVLQVALAFVADELHQFVVLS
jgi:hypothetical protein